MQIIQFDTYLNDAIINFGIVHQFSKLPPDTRKSIHIFDTHFYQQLIKSKLRNRNNLQGVRKWTKNTNLFEKQMVIFPVCFASHWFLIIVINPGVITVSLIKVNVLVKPFVFSFLMNVRIGRRKSPLQLYWTAWGQTRDSCKEHLGISFC